MLKLSTVLTGLCVPALAAISLAAAPAHSGFNEEKVRDVSEFNLNKGLAIDGYDPVAYFPEGGSKPAKGSAAISWTHEAVTYRFVSKEHLELFKKTPAKYEPVYGGWCAFSMADKGKQVDPNPKNFLVQNGRLHLFFKSFFGNGRKQWEKRGSAVMKPKADANWKKILDAKKRGHASTSFE